MTDRSPLQIGVALLFVVVFVATGAGFVSVEANYMGVLERDSITATVSDYEMTAGPDGPAVLVTVEVTNPTPATVELQSAQSLAAYRPDGGRPVARVMRNSINDRRIQSGGTETLEISLQPTGDAESLRTLVEERRLTITGTLSSHIRTERVDINVVHGVNDS